MLTYHIEAPVYQVFLAFGVKTKISPEKQLTSDFYGYFDGEERK